MAAPKSKKSVTRVVTGDNKNFPICDDERRQMIKELAYQKAVARNFENGSPEEDWLEAEREVDERIHYVR